MRPHCGEELDPKQVAEGLKKRTYDFCADIWLLEKGVSRKAWSKIVKMGATWAAFVSKVSCAPLSFEESPGITNTYWFSEALLGGGKIFAQKFKLHV